MIEENTVIVPTYKKGESEREWRKLQREAHIARQTLSEREWPTVLQHLMMHAESRGIRFRYADGRDFGHPHVDDVWKDERYIRSFLRHEVCTHPAKDELVALCLMLMMRYPEEIEKAKFIG